VLKERVDELYKCWWTLWVLNNIVFEPYWRVLILSIYLIFGQPSHNCISRYFTSCCFRVCIRSCVSLYINLTLVFALIYVLLLYKSQHYSLHNIMRYPMLKSCISIVLVHALVSVLVLYKFLPNNLYNILNDLLNYILKDIMNNLPNYIMNDIMQPSSRLCITYWTASIQWEEN
jgi:hypothetical protein